MVLFNPAAKARLSARSGQKPKIFILTCPCQKEQKIDSAKKLIKANRLDGLIRGDDIDKDTECGGFAELEYIIKNIINEPLPLNKLDIN